MFKVKAYGYNEDDLKKRVPLRISDEAKYYKYLKTIAEEYPFLAIVGLRIITEIKLKDFFKNKKITFNDRDTLGVLINKLPNTQIQR